MLLTIHNLHKTYRLGRVDVPVLRGVSMSVEKGEWVALLGASGSGKSTLLHLVGGLDRPDRAGQYHVCTECGYALRRPSETGKCPECGAGMAPTGPARIEFDGRDVTRFGQRALDRYRSTEVGFVFQFYHLLPELTVTQNVLLAGMVRHGRVGYLGARGDLQKRAAELLEAVGLGHRLGHRPVELSGGERQRVAIARALLNQPTLLLADEPTGNLDKATGGQIMSMLADLRRRTDQTMLMVTHDPEVAARADRVITLVDGRAVGADAAAARA
jgi:lipoprotein-releasing system ATP-binding protein